MTVPGFYVKCAWDFDGDGGEPPIVSAEANTQTVTIPVGVPARPSNVGVSAGVHGASLTWTNNSQIATGFTIQRQGPGGSWQTIGTTDINDPNPLSFEDDEDELHSATAYSYRVLANGPGGPSEESDEELTVTQYGNGLVYAGTEGTDYPSYDGVSASWSGDTGLPELADNSISVTISNLPEHYGLSIRAYATYARQGPGSGNPDGNLITVSALGQEKQWHAGGHFFTHEFNFMEDHEGGSVTITFTGSDFAAADAWWPPYVEVGVLRYRATVESASVTVTDSETVNVTVRDEDGNPRSGVQVTGAIHGSAVELEESTASSNGQGIASFLLNGLVKGTATLVVTLAKGGTGRAAQAAVDPIITAGSAEKSLYVGQVGPNRSVEFTLTGNKGPMASKTVRVYSSAPDKVKVGGSFTTNAEGKIVVPLEALKSTIPEPVPPGQAQPADYVTVTAGYGNSTDKVKVKVLPIIITGVPKKITLQKNTTQGFAARAVIPGDETDVPDISIRAHIGANNLITASVAPTMENYGGWVSISAGSQTGRTTLYLTAGAPGGTVVSDTCIVEVID